MILGGDPAGKAAGTVLGADHHHVRPRAQAPASPRRPEASRADDEDKRRKGGADSVSRGWSMLDEHGRFGGREWIQGTPIR